MSSCPLCRSDCQVVPLGVIVSDNDDLSSKIQSLWQDVLIIQRYFLTSQIVGYTKNHIIDNNVTAISRKWYKQDHVFVHNVYVHVSLIIKFEYMHVSQALCDHMHV